MQLKAFAEALKLEIEVTDAERLKYPPLVYSPTPAYTIKQPPQSNLFGSKPTSRLLLYEEHYYPLFPKGRFPNHRLGQWKEDGVQQNYEIQNDVVIHDNIESSVTPVTSSTLPRVPISPSSGQTQVKVHNAKHPNDELWEYVDKELFTSPDTDNEPTSNSLITSEMVIRTKSPSIEYVPKDEPSSREAIPLNNHAGPRVGKYIGVETEPRNPSVINIPNAEVNGNGLNGGKVWAAVGIGALGLGLLTLGGFAMDFLFGSSSRRAKKEAARKLNSPQDEVLVRARW